MDSPWTLLETWYAAAVESEPRVPDAMQVATADARGRTSVRTVLLKAHGPDVGLVFYTNFDSRKGRQLDENPWASICLNWKTTRRQVLAEGPVERVDDATADAYFASRSLGSRIGAWASDQSRPLSDRVALVDKVAQTTARFAGKTVTRPPFWGGYRIRPERFEFWSDRADRLHERRLFVRQGEGWAVSLLYP